MACLKPFKAIRTAKDYQDVIPALPYDVYNRADAKQFVKNHPHSFLAIDRPETNFDDVFDMYSKEAYEKANTMIKEWISEGSLVQDDKDCYYLYELTMNGKSQTGLVACASIDDYIDGTIKKHENTLEAKEQDRINHIYATKMQTGPIFLACKSNAELLNIFYEIKNDDPIYDFRFDDGVLHRVWKIGNEKTIEKIQSLTNKMENIYIADGHHRCASAVKVGLQLREENPRYTGKEEFNYFLSVTFLAGELLIMDYNRVVKDLNGISENEFLEKLKSVFEFVEESKSKVKPQGKSYISMYLQGMWYCLKIKDKYLSDDPVEGMDVSILQNQVLDKLLGIKDPKNDSRINFIGGIKGLEELEKCVNNNYAVAFAMYPTSIEELFAVADAGLLMPPKSTWFEPKLRSGIFLHDIH